MGHGNISSSTILLDGLRADQVRVNPGSNGDPFLIVGDAHIDVFCLDEGQDMQYKLAQVDLLLERVQEWRDLVASVIKGVK